MLHSIPHCEKNRLTQKPQERTFSKMLRLFNMRLAKISWANMSRAHMSRTTMFSASFLSTSLSFALIFSPFCTTLAPKNALAQSANGQTFTFDFKYGEDGTGTELVTNTQIYAIFAGNVGGSNDYNSFFTGNASVNNNTLYVESGAGISTDISSSNSPTTSYEVSGAAGLIALTGYGNSATATGNTVIMDADFIGGEVSDDAGYAISSTGYISNLTGVYIGINNVDASISDAYQVTTVDTVTASNNSVILKNGYVGLGYTVTSTSKTLTDTGKYLTGAYVQSYNINSDAQFNLYNNSVLIEGGTVADRFNDTTIGALAGAYVNTITGNATMSGNSVTITGGDVQADVIAGALFAGVSSGDISFEVSNGITNNNSTATMFNNSVTITGAEEDFSAQTIAGAYSSATSASTLYNNSVYISGGTFISDTAKSLYITGSYISPNQWNEVVDVDSNSLITPDGTTVNMNAYNNSVTITEGEIKGTVTGAVINVQVANGGNALTGQLTYNGTISNNTVNIYGGTFKATANSSDYYNGIYGGVYQGQDNSSASSGGTLVHNYSVTNNTVNIGFEATVESGVNIGGGAYNNSSNSDASYFTLTPNANTYDGNTLNLYHLTGSNVEAGTVANFENINFVLGAGDSSDFLATSDGAVLTATTLYLGNGYDDETDADNNDGTVATKYANFGLHTSLYNTLSAGDTVTLMELENSIDTSDGTSAVTIDGTFTNLNSSNNGTYTGTHGALLSRTWSIVTDTSSTNDSTTTTTTTTMTATLLSTQAGEQSKILGEVSLANMTAITNSTDLLVGSAIPTAYEQISSNLAVSTNSLDSQNSQDSGL